MFDKATKGFTTTSERRKTMSTAPKNAGKRWTSEEKSQLVELAKANTPTGVIALKLKRTEDAVRSMASKLGQSLKPTNQAPYGPRKN